MVMNHGKIFERNRKNNRWNGGDEMIDRVPLSIESAEALSLNRPDIALGVAKIVSTGISVYVSGGQNIPKEPIPLADQWASVRERLQPTLDQLRSKTALVGEV